MNDLELTLNLVAHETRHLYQGQAKKDPEAFDIPVLITDTWITNEEIVYQRKPWEIDARAFAALTASY